MAVSSSEIISAANFELSVTQVDILNKTYKITTLEMLGRFIRQYSISQKMTYLHDLPLIKYKGPDCHHLNVDFTEYNCSDNQVLTKIYVFKHKMSQNMVVLHLFIHRKIISFDVTTNQRFQ